MFCHHSQQFHTFNQGPIGSLKLRPSWLEKRILAFREDNPLKQGRQNG